MSEEAKLKEATKYYVERNIPHVVFMATYSNQGESWEEPMVLNVTTLNNARSEVIDHYRKKGWPVIGYGCLSEKHRDLVEHLETLTELAQEKRKAASRGRGEAKQGG